ncbi:protoporphyrinogen/coproporphyrinogen oxidase [Bdellovibrio sp. HCB337]|uniref:protoporphyrinogen/coproporphyrinogen oxidase n=1 Tax=Bdellovibrio sp. HCB337 TaxID=3394358 RepID=UPI0039A4A9F5
MKKVTVVGGGFSGLVTAYYLSREGFAVDLHEASHRLGGLLGSERTKNGLVETAANGFINCDDLEDLFKDLGLEPLKPQAHAKKRFIYRDGLKRWPLKFFESLGLATKFLFKLFLAKKSLRPTNQETIFNWGLRNLSPSATDYLLGPGLQGIYAGDIRRMSAELVLGPLFQGGKKKKYRGTVSLANGMGDFVMSLVQKLSTQGVKIHLNSKYKVESLSEPHVVAVSASAVPSVIEKVAPQAAAELQKIEVLPVLSVTVFYKEAPKKIEGFGALFPADQGFKVLGVLSPTYIFANRGPEYSETWIFGGTHSPEMLLKSESELREIILAERAKILGSSAEIKDIHIYPWPKALPHYTLAHQEILKNLHLPQNLYLAGNYLGVIGLSKILSRSKELASQMKRTHS